MNINQITENTQAVIQLVHPKTKAPLGMSVTLAGPEHPKRKALEFARARAMRDQINLTGKFQIDDPEKTAETAIDDLVGITLDWDLSLDGTKVPYSADAALDLYSDPKRAWLRRQIMAEKDKLENFIEDSAGA